VPPQKKGAAVDASARITLEVVEVNGEVNGVDAKKRLPTSLPTSPSWSTPAQGCVLTGRRYGGLFVSSR